MCRIWKYRLESHKYPLRRYISRMFPFTFKNYFEAVHCNVWDILVWSMINMYGVRIFYCRYFDRSSIETSVWHSHGDHALLAFPVLDSHLAPEHLSPACTGHIFISHWTLQFPSVLSVPVLSISNFSVLYNLMCANCHWGSTLKGHKGRFIVESSSP